MKQILVIILALALATAGGCADALLVKPVKLPSKVKMVTIEQPDGASLNKVAQIRIDGVLFAEDSRSGGNRLRILKQQLALIKADSSVKGILLAVNSPGGGVSTSDLLFHEILAFKERTGLPVVAQIDGVGASGGYYVALAADEIYASPASITGSIGVIMQLFNLQGLMDKIGVGAETIKTGPMKDMGSPFHGLSAEDRAIFQQIIDSLHDRFVRLIVEHRKELTREDVDKLADGRVFTAQQAADLKLIDGVQYPGYAFDRVKTLARIRDAKITGFILPIMASTLTVPSADLSLLRIDASSLAQALTPGFYYLWFPTAD